MVLGKDQAEMAGAEEDDPTDGCVPTSVPGLNVFEIASRLPLPAVQGSRERPLAEAHDVALQSASRAAELLQESNDVDLRVSGATSLDAELPQSQLLQSICGNDTNMLLPRVKQAAALRYDVNKAQTSRESDMESKGNPPCHPIDTANAQSTTTQDTKTATIEDGDGIASATPSITQTAGSAHVETSSLNAGRFEALERARISILSVNESETLGAEILSHLRSETRKWATEHMLQAIERDSLYKFLQKLAARIHFPAEEHSTTILHECLYASTAILWTCADPSLTNQEINITTELLSPALHYVQAALNAFLNRSQGALQDGAADGQGKSKYAAGMQQWKDNLKEALESVASLIEAGRAPEDFILALSEQSFRLLTSIDTHDTVKHAAVLLVEAIFGRFTKQQEEIMKKLASSACECEDASWPTLAFVQCFHAGCGSLEPANEFALIVVNTLRSESHERKSALKLPIGKVVKALLKQCDDPNMPGSLLALRLIEWHLHKYLTSSQQQQAPSPRRRSNDSGSRGRLGEALAIEILGIIAERLKNFSSDMHRLQRQRSDAFSSVVENAYQSVQSWIDTRNHVDSENLKETLIEFLALKSALIELAADFSNDADRRSLLPKHRVAEFLLGIWRCGAESQSNSFSAVVKVWCDDQLEAIRRGHARSPIGSRRLSSCEQKMLAQVVHSHGYGEQIANRCFEHILSVLKGSRNTTTKSKASHAFRDIIKADPNMLRVKGALDVITEELCDGVPSVRSDGIRVLLQCAQRDESKVNICYEYIRKLLNDSEVQVRRMAASAIGNFVCFENFDFKHDAIAGIASLSNDQNDTVVNEAMNKVFAYLLQIDSTPEQLEYNLASAAYSVLHERQLSTLPLPFDFPIISVIHFGVKERCNSKSKISAAPDQISQILGKISCAAIQKLSDFCKGLGNTAEVLKHVLLLQCFIQAEFHRPVDTCCFQHFKLTLEVGGTLLRHSYKHTQKTSAQGPAYEGCSDAPTTLSAFACSCILQIICAGLDRSGTIDKELAYKLSDVLCNVLYERNERQVLRNACSALCSLAKCSEYGLQSLAKEFARQQRHLQLLDGLSLSRPLAITGYLLEHGTECVETIAQRDNQAKWNSAHQWREKLYNYFKEAEREDVSAYAAGAFLRAIIGEPKAVLSAAEDESPVARKWFHNILKCSLVKEAASPLKQHTLQCVLEMLWSDERHENQGESTMEEADATSTWHGGIEAEMSLGPLLAIHRQQLHSMVIDQNSEVRSKAVQVAEQILKQRLIAPYELSANLIAAVLDPESIHAQEIAGKALQHISSMQQEKQVALSSGMRDGVTNAFQTFAGSVASQKVSEEDAWSSVTKGIHSLLASIPKTERMMQELAAALIIPIEDHIPLKIHNTDMDGFEMQWVTVKEAEFRARLLCEMLPTLQTVSSKVISTCCEVLDRRLADIDADGAAGMHDLLDNSDSLCNPAGFQSLVQLGRKVTVATVLVRLRASLRYEAPKTSAWVSEGLASTDVQNLQEVRERLNSLESALGYASSMSHEDGEDMPERCKRNGNPNSNSSSSQSHKNSAAPRASRQRKRKSSSTECETSTRNSPRALQDAVNLRRARRPSTTEPTLRISTDQAAKGEETLSDVEIDDDDDQNTDPSFNADSEYRPNKRK